MNRRGRFLVGVIFGLILIGGTAGSLAELPPSLAAPAVDMPVPVMVKDINTQNTDGDPGKYTELNDVMYFTAFDPVHGTELWKSDGTANGTSLVKDIFPGRDPYGIGSDIDWLTVYDNTLYFSARESMSVYGIWKSDGTTAGTELAVSGSLLPSYYPPKYIFTHNSLIYFITQSDDTLWKTDGTQANTQMVKEFSSQVWKNQVTIFQNQIFFLMFNINNDTMELWKSNGVNETGTTLVKNLGWHDINDEIPLVVAGEDLFVGGYDSANGHELWISNGTELGTTLLKDINPGGSSRPHDAITLNDQIYFFADDGTNWHELWTSDGTELGTTLVKDINSSGDSFPLTNYSGLVHLVNGAFFFPATDGTHGKELWRSDGTSGGTYMVSDINPGSASGLEYWFHIDGYNNLILFGADDGTTGLELWVSDGSQGNANRIADINPGSSSSVPGRIGIFGGYAYFSADDGVSGSELWRTDGSTASFVKDLNPYTDSAAPRYLTNVNGILFFSASDGEEEGTHGTELWKSSGEGTLMVKDINPGTPSNDLMSSDPMYLTQFKGKVYFAANNSPYAGNGNGNELWVSDGTEAGTKLVKDIVPGYDSSDPADLYPAGDNLFFRVEDDLWATDGTETGTKLLMADVASDPMPLGAVGNIFYFKGYGGGKGVELWRSDGTVVGTTLVKDIANGTDSSYPAWGAVINGKIYFAALDAGYANRELWVSDGTEAGTVRVIDIESGGDSNPECLTNINSVLYFRAFQTGSGIELWKSDGTEGGTTLVNNINSSGDSYPCSFVGMGGKVYFPAVDDTYGIELWYTDGTSDGTDMVADINTGGDGLPDQYDFKYESIVVGSHLYFRAQDGTNGWELWRSDGTAVGTEMAADINPDEGESNPDWFTLTSGHLFFSAIDEYLGSELWMIPASELWEQVFLPIIVK